MSSNQRKIAWTVRSFIDYRDKTHSIPAEPHEIRVVCGLLKKVKISSVEFLKITEQLLDYTKSGEEFQFNYEPELLFEKIRAFLPENNFETISVQDQIVGGFFVGTIQGFAEGKYSKKRVALSLMIHGTPGVSKSNVKVEICAQDPAMTPTLISEIMDGTRWKGNEKNRDDIIKIVKYAQQKGGIITEEGVIADLGMNLKHVKKAFKSIAKNSLARLSDTHSGGKQWIFVGLCST